ncbi:VOC family protein [Prauserella cavernicola]|uniref:VOC family protein n=1 Tax=Prauserella cavernicola TaxID=2800127 RepID=A0A934QYG0_9PSEU|nr:VOC family protein [Prauserella cavernicola]MBK1788821.1 VOC family protein [Prauserella cavernicola]
MVTRDTPWPDGTPSWLTLMVPDPRMAIDFYGALFGWSFTDLGDELDNYLLAALGGREVGGVLGIPPDRPDQHAAWTTFLATSDLERSVAAIGEHGGRVLVAPTEAASAGRLAVAEDPAGAAFGLWEAGEHIGIRVANVAGAPTWNECLVRDYDRDREFYARLFGYTFDDESGDGFRYATLKVGGAVVGGIGQLPETVPADVPPHWSTYFAVADTDAAVHRITELGGAVVSAPSDSPYGRLALVTDNQGVYFRVIAS